MLNAVIRAVDVGRDIILTFCSCRDPQSSRPGPDICTRPCRGLSAPQLPKEDSVQWRCSKSATTTRISDVVHCIPEISSIYIWHGRYHKRKMLFFYVCFLIAPIVMAIRKHIIISGYSYCLHYFYSEPTYKVILLIFLFLT